MNPVLGQEAVVPKHGLGRITCLPHDGGIEVTPYVCGYPITFDRKNVVLVKLNLPDEGEITS